MQQLHYMLESEQTAAPDRLPHLAALVQSDLSRFERESGLTTAWVHLLWVPGESGSTASSPAAT